MNENIKNRFCVPDEVLEQYFDNEKIISVEEIGSGYISPSYLVTFLESKYVLQRIDEGIYSSPYGVIMNLETVTKELRRVYIYEGLDHRNSVIKLVNTIDDEPAALYDDEYWKCRRYLCDVTRIFTTTNLDIISEAAKTIASFSVNLKELHARTIVDTIPHFHDTENRFTKLVDASRIDEFDRTSNCVTEISYLYLYDEKYKLFNNLIENKVLPRHICHNNPKLCNVIFEENTLKGIGLSNLETIMKGTLCFEFGDALRSICSNCEDHSVTPDSVTIYKEGIEVFIKSYLEACKDFIIKEEVDHLYDGWLISTLELAIRYVTDYINGDVYFKYDPKTIEEDPEINLTKARIQIALAKQIEKDEVKNYFIKVLNETLKSLGYPEEFLQ